MLGRLKSVINLLKPKFLEPSISLMSLLIWCIVTNVAQGGLSYSAGHIEVVIEEAESFWGTSYKWGGNSHKGIDCSGLMQQSFRHAGIYIPRNSRAQANYWRGFDVERSNLQKGDLIFFKKSGTKNYISHVGLVTSTEGNKVKFIHSSSRPGVADDYLSGIWAKKFVKGKRLFETIESEKKTQGRTDTDFPGKYPQASEKFLTYKDLVNLTGLDRWKLSIMRNEIFARHGYRFHRNTRIIKYFQQQHWYNEIPKVSEDAAFIDKFYLSEIEKHNIKLIKSYE
jgi:hypothetical protein